MRQHSAISTNCRITVASVAVHQSNSAASPRGSPTIIRGSDQPTTGMWRPATPSSWRREAVWSTSAVKRLSTAPRSCGYQHFSHGAVRCRGRGRPEGLTDWNRGCHSLSIPIGRVWCSSMLSKNSPELSDEVDFIAALEARRSILSNRMPPRRPYG
jgi:hypothetical protein